MRPHLVVQQRCSFAVGASVELVHPGLHGIGVAHIDTVGSHPHGHHLGRPGCSASLAVIWCHPAIFAPGPDALTGEIEADSFTRPG